MTSDFEKHITEDRRLILLRALESASQYSVNANLLQRFCERTGHNVSTDRIHQDLAWLEEQGLTKIRQAEDIMVATLTVRGQDVATGRVKVPGVKVPAPGA